MEGQIEVDRRVWGRGAHEQAVENFYSHGAEKYGDWHGGYLNFGLWEPGVASYLEAAENMVATLARLGGIGPGSQVLDVGCGMGAQDVYLAQRFRPKHITAIDVTWDHVRAARARVARAGVEGVEVRHGTATALEFGQGSFTHVLGIEGPVHFNTRERFFREAYRVLRPGGVLLLADYTGKRPAQTPVERALLALGKRGWCIPDENADDTTSYVHKLERTGFAEVAVRSAGDQTYPQYYREQQSREHRAQIRRIRGLKAAYLGQLIDYFAFTLHQRGLVDYVLVRAIKPATMS